MSQSALATEMWRQISKWDQDFLRSFLLPLIRFPRFRSQLARRLHVEHSLFCGSDLFGGGRGCPSEWSALHSGRMRTALLPCGCGDGLWDCRVLWTLNCSWGACTTRPCSSFRSEDSSGSSSSIRPFPWTWTLCCVTCSTASASHSPSMAEGSQESRGICRAWNQVWLS